MDAMQKFWNKWLKADELEREQIIETLPVLTEGVTFEEPMLKKLHLRLINSFFNDLEEILTAEHEKKIKSLQLQMGEDMERMRSK